MPRVCVVMALIPATAIGWAQTTSTGSNSGPADSNEAQKRVVVHLSHFTDDRHRSAMALRIAGVIQQHGSQVLLFLDRKGVRLAERCQEPDLSWATDAPTLAELYERFTESGGRGILCPRCAGSARIGDMAVRRHANIGSEQDLAEMFAEADKVIDD